MGCFKRIIEKPEVLDSLKHKMSAVPSANRECKFVRKLPYKYSTDSVLLQGLPVGTYMLEFISDNKDVPVRRVLLAVTMLRRWCKHCPLTACASSC